MSHGTPNTPDVHFLRWVLALKMAQRTGTRHDVAPKTTVGHGDIGHSKFPKRSPGHLLKPSRILNCAHQSNPNSIRMLDPQPVHYLRLEYRRIIECERPVQKQVGYV